MPTKKSVTPDYLICLEDGKRLKTLKRYLRGRYKLSPDQYRSKWGLPSNYPMVAPNYSLRRSELAKKFGLGSVRNSSKVRSTDKNKARTESKLEKIAKTKPPSKSKK
mgnify:CR=1 FL=1